MLTWAFMGMVSLGTKCIPKSVGPETFVDIPKYPEVDPELIYKIVILRNTRALRYFPDKNAENWLQDVANWQGVYGKLYFTRSTWRW
jgi:hypothetical protein